MKKYLVCFGNEGLEAVVNITKLIDEDVQDKLTSDNPKSAGNKLNQTMSMLRLRIQFNHQRRIKSYILNYDGEECDIWDNAKFIIKKLKKEGKPIKL